MATAYTLTQEQQDAIRAAAGRAVERLTASERASVAFQTLLVKRPTSDEQMDGIGPLVIDVQAHRSSLDNPPTVPMGTAHVLARIVRTPSINKSAIDARRTFANVAADLEQDDFAITAINSAIMLALA